MAIEARMRTRDSASLSPLFKLRIPSATRNCLHERLGLFNGEYSDTSSALPGQIDEIRGIRQNQVPLDRLIQRRPQDRVGVADGASRKASVHQFAVERLDVSSKTPIPAFLRNHSTGGSKKSRSFVHRMSASPMTAVCMTTVSFTSRIGVTNKGFGTTISAASRRKPR